MELPDLEIANELKSDMANYESMWGLYEDFNNGLQELAKEDWISFRFNKTFTCFVSFAST
jgi:dynein heavy chain 2